ncbi:MULTISPECIES: hypothetical protein [Sphingobium]|jgi:hypothetical protein|uniref:hypothetical protein n=1 Tax=Sphingobium TaxID=165695 RepID=UPI0010F5CB5C|nr:MULTISPECIES: hypothetical protein [unclassified Sphingobium]UXC92941.1 hypothetical protein EGM87_21800 [Sphingobium sp. RSMS]
MVLMGTNRPILQSTFYGETPMASLAQAPASLFDFVQGITAHARKKSHKDKRLDVEAKGRKLLKKAR